jgi:hypothetical protein
LSLPIFHLLVLSLEVKQTKQDTFVHQGKYTKDLMKKFNMTELKSVTTPMSSAASLGPDEDGDTVDQREYMSMIGSLLYLTVTRPDIQFAVGLCARFQSFPRSSHRTAVQRIFRYLKNSLEFGIWYSASFASFLFPTSLARRHSFRAAVSLGLLAAAVTAFAPCEGLLCLESRAAGVAIFSLVRFFASKPTPPVLQLALFFPARLRFFVLGLAPGHGSRRAVSPCFLRQAVSRRQALSRFSLSIFRRCHVLLGWFLRALITPALTRLAEVFLGLCSS